MGDEQILGPFTLKQVSRIGGAIILLYIVAPYVPLKFFVPICIVVAGLFINWVINTPKVVVDEAYLQKKRFASKNVEEYQRWLKLRLSYIQAQIQFRAGKGLIEDPELMRKLKLFTDALRDAK